MSQLALLLMRTLIPGQRLNRVLSCFFLIGLFVAVVSISPAHADKDHPDKNIPNRLIVGWLEKVKIQKQDVVLHTRLDTGRSFSSIYSDSMKKIEKNGEEYIQFELNDRYGKHSTIEAPLVRTMSLRNHEGVSREAYVIQLGLCIGNYYMEDEVSFSSHPHLDQELILGRQSFEGQFIIDPSLSFTREPECD